MLDCDFFEWWCRVGCYTFGSWSLPPSSLEYNIPRVWFRLCTLCWLQQVTSLYLRKDRLLYLRKYQLIILVAILLCPQYFFCDAIDKKIKNLISILPYLTIDVIWLKENSGLPYVQKLHEYTTVNNLFYYVRSSIGWSTLCSTLFVTVLVVC